MNKFLSEKVEEDQNGTVFLLGVELNSKNARLRRHLYAIDARDIDVINNKIIESLKEFLMQRFLNHEDDIDLKTIRKFIEIS